MAQRLGLSATDSAGMAWDMFDFDSAIFASHLTIRASSVYTSGDNGFQEIQIYAEDRRFYFLVIFEHILLVN